jgi:peroxiredoxin
MQSIISKILIITFLLGLLYACSPKDATTSTTEKTEQATPAKKGYKPGDIVADFSLKNHDGNMASLAGLGDVQGVILTFTCNHCPYSVAYEDRLINLHNKYAPKGWPVFAINANDPEVAPDDSFEAMGVRAKEKGFPFKYTFDEGQKVLPLWGATRTPEIYLLKRAGKNFKLVYTGAIDNNYKDASAATERYVEEAISAVEKGKTPDPSFTKAVGCTIKIKS